jgi:glycosyltransferase involved in cell wall biosynthesis
VSLIVHAENGFLLPPGDDSALADALGAIARSPSEAADLGRCARQTIIERFSPEPQINKLEELLRDVGSRRTVTTASRTAV